MFACANFPCKWSAISWLTSGWMSLAILQYGRNKRAQKRAVRYDRIRDSLVWDSRKSRDGLPMGTVSSVHKGLASDILRAAASVDPNRCLSIHSLNRTLDLEAPSQSERDLLYRCVQACLESSTNRRLETQQQH